MAAGAAFIVGTQVRDRLREKPVLTATAAPPLTPSRR
jgi:hypothetical protein